MNPDANPLRRTDGNPGWQPVLEYVRDLHRRAIQPQHPLMPHPWETICPDDYGNGRSFGHWDIVHAVLDAVHNDPGHARRQIENLLAVQQPDGFLPGSIHLGEGDRRWNPSQGHPPVWPFAVQKYVERYPDDGLRDRALTALRRQIDWFDANRRADEGGYYYTDILNGLWESGVDEGIRFSGVPSGRHACVDATAHVYGMLEHAAAWADYLGSADPALEERRDALRTFIQTRLFAPENGFFYDIWAVRDPALRTGAFEGMWPVAVGAATAEQARRVVMEQLLHPGRFFARHPVATVAMDDPRFALRMWRGPAWNSMTYWAALGCARYGFRDAARTLLARALDNTALQFERTGTIWEFYDPSGGKPEYLKRKSHYGKNVPYRHYLGHNPLIAMAAMHAQLEG